MFNTGSMLLSYYQRFEALIVIVFIVIATNSYKHDGNSFFTFQKVRSQKSR